jgi:hypothetical protein
LFLADCDNLLFSFVVTIIKSTATNIYLTLTERTTISSANYLFIAKHRGTNAQVAFVMPANTSLYPDRYDKFSISQFANSDLGFWDYIVYQQASSSNVDPAAATEIERGYMQLIDSPQYSTTQYAGVDNQYKVYNG